MDTHIHPTIAAALRPFIPRTPSVTITYAGIQLEVEYDYHRAEKPVYDADSPVCGPGCDASVDLHAVRHLGGDIQELLDAQTLAEIEARVLKELDE